MKTLQDYRNDFMKEASEYDLGRKEEDFHSYLRHHNLEHHLSETQIRERNMENNKLNSLGLLMGVGVPLSLASIYGMNKLINNKIIGHGNFRENTIRDIDSLTNRVFDIPTDRPVSITGFNRRPMPTAPHHIGQSVENTLGLLQNDLMSNIRNRKIGLLPPTND